MEISIIIVALVILGSVITYFRGREDVMSLIRMGIAEAETKYADAIKSGAIKKKYAIAYVHSMLPVYLQKIFTEEWISNTIEMVLSDFQEFAKANIDNAVTSAVNAIKEELESVE